MDRDGVSLASGLVVLLVGLGGGLCTLAGWLVIIDGVDLIDPSARFNQAVVFFLAGLGAFGIALMVRPRKRGS